jgi:hypothetical protein
MRFAQLYDRAEAGAGPTDTGGLAGTWVNSNPETNGIARMLMTEAGGKLSLRVYAVGPEGLIDWGEASGVTVFAPSPTSKSAAGFACLYDFGFVETRLQAMILKGLIVLAQFHRFKDESGRADFFVREYFALEHGRY